MNEGYQAVDCVTSVCASMRHQYVYEVRVWIGPSSMIRMGHSHQISLCDMETSFTNPGSSSTSHSDVLKADVLADAGGEDPAKLRLSARASSSSSLSCVVGGD